MVTAVFTFVFTAVFTALIHFQLKLYLLIYTHQNVFTLLKHGSAEINIYRKCGCLVIYFDCKRKSQCEMRLFASVWNKKCLCISISYDDDTNFSINVSHLV